MIVDGKAWLFRPWQSVVAAVRGSGFGGGLACQILQFNLVALAGESIAA